MGRAAALRFAAEGATVVGCDLNPQTSAETVRLVHRGRRFDDCGRAGRPVVVRGDAAVGRRGGGGARRHRRAVQQRFACRWSGRGTTSPSTTGTPVSGTSSIWSSTHARSPGLISSPAAAGSIINIASIASIRGAAFFQQAAHGAAKGGVLSFTYHLAAAGGPHRIRANAILPGLIRTPSTEFLFASPDAPGSTWPQPTRWAASVRRTTWPSSQRSLPRTMRGTSTLRRSPSTAVSPSSSSDRAAP